MLRELKAPPAAPKPPSPPVTAKATASQPAPPTPPPSTEGWKVVRGPFTFEDGRLNDWKGDDGGVADVGEFEGRKCLRAKPGGKPNCRVWRGSSQDSAGLRVRFRYFAHDMEYVEVLWAQGSHRPRKRITPLVPDGWSEACFTGRQIGGNATRLMHVEIGGPGKSNGAFLLLDDIVVEKQ
jgi:hypothetical protein